MNAAYTYAVEIINDKPHRKVMDMKLREIYVSAYDEFCNYVNPRYSRWNEEYDNTGGPNDGVNSDGTINEDSEYNRFIVEKYKPIFRKLEKKWPKYIREVFAGEECDFRIRWFDGSVTQLRLVTT